jgi:hypothetical protein
MKSYKVLRSFSGPQLGSHSEGDVIQLADEEAAGLVHIGFIEPIVEDAPAEIEIADLPLEKVEKAVIKRKKKASE